MSEANSIFKCILVCVASENNLSLNLISNSFWGVITSIDFISSIGSPLIFTPGLGFGEATVGVIGVTFSLFFGFWW